GPARWRAGTPPDGAAGRWAAARSGTLATPRWLTSVTGHSLFNLEVGLGLEGLVHLLHGLLRGGRPIGDRTDAGVHLVADGGRQILVEVELERRGVGHALLDQDAVDLARRDLRVQGHRDDAGLLLQNPVIRLGSEEHQEVDRVVRSVGAHRVAVAAAVHLVDRTGAALNRGEREPAEVVTEGRAGGALLHARVPLAHQVHGRATGAEDRWRAVLTAVALLEEAVLERLHVHQFLPQLSGLEEPGVVERLRLARGGVPVHAHDPDRQVGEPVVLGPRRRAGDRDRGDPRLLQRGDRVEELTPGRRRVVRVQPGLLEQRLVVPHSDHAHVEREAVDPTVDRVRRLGARRHVLDDVGHVVGDVLHQAGPHVLREHAAAPTVEDVRRVARLHGGGERRLEVVVRDRLRLDVRVVRLVELLRELWEEVGQRLLTGLDVPPTGTSVATPAIATAR